MKSVFKRCSLLPAVLFLLFSSVSSSAYASSIADWRTDSETGWVKMHNRHMGTKYTTYSYENAYTKAKYQAYVEAGIDKWGVSIHCVESTSNRKGIYARSAVSHMLCLRNNRMLHFRMAQR